MLNNFIPGEWKENKYYELVFDDGHNNGFCFPCSKEGIPVLNSSSKVTYEYCMAHREKFIRFNIVITRIDKYMEYSQGTCNCGQTFQLFNEYLGACSCPNCGQWYNLFGQELNPPDTWEE